MGVKKRMAFLLAILSVLACAFSVSAESGTDVAALQDTQLMASSEITVGDITYSISDVEATVIGISGSMSSVSIPARITSGGVTYTVVAIADDVGSGNDKITSISFLDADNLLSIGENCFSYCTSLETVSFIDGGTKLESIGNYAFYYCPKLKSVSNIDTQNSLQKVGASVFGLTPFMSSLTEEFVMFGNVLIKYNGDAKNVVVPQGTVAISDAFYGKDIVSINFGTSLKYVGDKAFYNCKELESVVLPSTCKSVGDMAFSGCSSLKRVTYAEGLTNIGFCSFANCDALFSFVYGGEGSSNLTEVGEYAFWNDRRLFYFDIGEIENVNIGAFWNCFGETPDEVGSVYY
ncbi:MAG: leucine-rich repeat domain-containing protein [Clostridia bacterium]|nr:leucine-rich repeat domain-containing protein [Clostridia bacterium]